MGLNSLKIIKKKHPLEKEEEQFVIAVLQEES